MTNEIVLEKHTVEGLLASRKMTLSHLNGSAKVEGENVVFGSFGELNDLAGQISVPVAAFFEKGASDLDDGVKIARRDDTFKREEIRDGEHYYTYHHLATTSAEPSLMALRLDVHCHDPQKITLNAGHGSKELVYVTKGTVQVQWTNTEGTMREDVLNEGDSIFVWPNTPHSFTALNADSPAEIIAVNYG